MEYLELAGESGAETKAGQVATKTGLIPRLFCAGGVFNDGVKLASEN